MVKKLARYRDVTAKGTASLALLCVWHGEAQAGGAVGAAAGAAAGAVGAAGAAVGAAVGAVGSAVGSAVGGGTAGATDLSGSISAGLTSPAADSETNRTGNVGSAGWPAFSTLAPGEERLAKRQIALLPAYFDRHRFRTTADCLTAAYQRRLPLEVYK